ncbi:MAG TPA: hypothetical protein VFD70_05245 [Anaerolineae bacterium]|nr:hypothetical protein [Anaerolineae bacterium]
MRVLVALLFGLLAAACGSANAAQPIVPVVNETARAQMPPNGTIEKTHEPQAVVLPTPEVQPAPNGYYQDDDGLRFAIAQVQTQRIPNPTDEDRVQQYVVLTLTLTNYADPPKDVTGFPFAVWLVDDAAREEYASDISAPYTNALWNAIDQLNKGTVKQLGKNQTIRGELFFRAPLGVEQFNLVWQPDARRQWILQLPRLR